MEGTRVGASQFRNLYKPMMLWAVMPFLQSCLEFQSFVELGGLPEVSIDASATLIEGQSANINVVLSRAGNLDVVIEWSTTDDSAVAPGDYTAASGTLVIPAGQSLGFISVSTNDDASEESTEQFFIEITSVENADILVGRSTVSLSDNDGTPQISVAPSTALEDVGAMTFTVNLSSVAGQNITFDWATSDSSALAGSDYTASSGTGFIPAGSSSATFSVNITNDTLYEGTESFLVTLSNLVNADPGSVTASGTITDNESVPQLSISDVIVNEGNAASFTVSISPQSSVGINVDWVTQDGTATGPSDFSIGSSTLVIPALASTASLSVNTASDTTDEEDETFQVVLSNPVGAALLDASGTATIQDDDVAPSLSISDVTVVEGVPASATLTLSQASGKTISVDYATGNGTAISGADYSASTGTLTIAAGSTTATITVNTLDDSTNESSESFSIFLSSPTNVTLSDATSVITVTDNDSAPILNVDNVTINEGANAVFTASLTAPSSQNITFDWAVSAGTASIPGDLGSASGSGLIAAGDLSASISIATLDDSISESSENFTVTISNVVNATGGSLIGTATLNDNDSTPSLSLGDTVVAEGGTATLTVTISPPSSSGITVDWATSNDTAQAPGDYPAATGSLSIPALSSTYTFSVNTEDDSIDENNEAFNVTLSNPVGATLLDATGAVTISDDDAAPSLSISDLSITEGATASLAVTLSSVSGKAITVDYATNNGSALSGSDYTGVSGTLAIPAGALGGIISVTSLEDVLNEGDESLTVSLSNPVEASIADNSGTITIADNDNAPLLSIDNVTVAEGANASFTVTLSAISALNVSFDWTTSAGTASIPGDLAAASGSGSIPAGSTSTTLTISTVDDVVSESSENFTIVLSNVVNAGNGNLVGTGTISDNETLPQISVSDAVVTEGGNASFTVNLTPAASSDVTVDWVTGNATATAPSDYTTSSSTLTIPAGATSASIAITTVDDTLDEDVETFNLFLSNPFGAAIADGSAVATINDNDAAPNLTIADISVTEGATASLTVVVDAQSGKPISVDWATGNGTALAGEDYTGNSGTVVIPAGATSATLNVNTLNDALHENTEGFTVVLSNPIECTIADNLADVTINDNDSAPVISITPASAAEGGTLSFTVSLSAASSLDTTFDWATADVSAVAGSDYTSNSGSETIFAGDTSIVLTVNTLENTAYESNETFNIVLSNPGNSTIGTGTGVGTISDNDPAPNLAINDVTVDEDAGTAVFTVTRTGSTEADINFDWSTVSGTAVPTQDYTAVVNTTETIPAASTSITVSVPIVDDASDENIENFTVTLTNPVNAVIADADGVGTINDNDAEPTLSIADLTVTEGGSASFVVSVSEPSGKSITFDWGTSDGTASSPADFTAKSVTGATIPPNTSSINLVVNTVDDSIDEGGTAETFSVSATNPSNASFSDATAVATLVDNDGSLISISSTSLNENASTMTFVVTLSASNLLTVTADWETVDGTASSPSDFTYQSGTVSFAPGETSKNIDIPIIDNTAYEGNETFTVVLSNPTNGSLSIATGTGTIIENDLPPELSINDVSTGEGSALVFTVSISGSREIDASVNWSTSNGTATTGGGDYTASSGTVTIPVGSPSVTVSVPTLDDSTNEADETLSVILAAPTHATLLDNTGVGTIIDNDSVPSLSINDVIVTEGTATATMTVSLSQASGKTVTFDWATQDSTATTASGDYVAGSGTLSINPGSTSKTFTVALLDDAVPCEWGEVIQVLLSNPVEATIGDNLGTITFNDNEPKLSVNNPTVTEGGSAAFVVSLDQACPSYDVSFNYATSNGTATTAGNDYTATSGAGTITAGNTTFPVSVATNDDALGEVSETFSLTISSPAFAVIQSATGTASITDNDSAPGISVADVTVPEGSTANFVVTLSAAAGSSIDVDWATSDVTAVSGSDYTGGSGVRNIPAGATSRTVTRNTTNDTADESDETFIFTLSNPTYGTLLDDVAIATIVDNDADPTLSINDVVVVEGNTATFTITLSAASAQTITFDWSTADGTALSAEGDYIAASGTGSIPAGATSTTVNVSASEDALWETNETFQVILSNISSGSITDSTGVATVTEDDPAPTISIADVSLTEGGVATLTVSLNTASAATTGFSWSTADVSAVAGSDYTAQSLTPVSIAPGDTSAILTVSTTSDTLYEDSETFTVNLSSPSNATISDSQAIVTLTDDDVEPTLSIATPADATEGDTITFTVSLSSVAGRDVTVHYVTSDDTALAGSDYTLTSGTLLIAAGNTSNTIDVPTLADTHLELPQIESFDLTLSSPSGASLLVATASGTILDDEEPRISQDLVSGGDVSSDFVVVGSKAFYLADADTDGVQELYSANLDGTSIAKLNGALVGGGSVTSFQVTPNGSRVIYLADEEVNDRFELYSVLPDGSSKVKLNPTPSLSSQGVQSFEITDNSASVVVLGDLSTDGMNELYSVSVSGAAWTKVSDTLITGGNVTDFRLSSDSSLIVYRADLNTDDLFELFSVNVSGSNHTLLSGVLTFGGNVTSSFDFTPDGTYVLFIADKDVNEDFELYSVLPDGSSLNQVNGTLTPGGDVTAFKVAQASNRVAYLADEDTNEAFELYAADLDGSNAAKLNATMTSGGDVTSFDVIYSTGKVVYLSDENTNDVFELFGVDSDGSNHTSLSGSVASNRDVTAFKVTSTGSRVLYVADTGTDEKFELFSVTPAGGSRFSVSGAAMVLGGDVVSFEPTPDGASVVFVADRDTNDVFEVFTSSVTASSVSVVNSTLVSGGDVGAFKILSDSSAIVYRADLLTDEVQELFFGSL